MKKILFLIALFTLMGGVNSVKAKILEVNLSSLPASSENTTWDNSTKTFAWSSTGYNSTELFATDNYSTYTTLNLKTTAGTADHFRIIVRFTNGADQVIINPIAVGNVSITLTDYITLANLANVSSIRLSGANDVATGNIKVSRVYLEGPDYIKQTTVKVAPDGVTNINGLEGAGSYIWNVSYPVTIGSVTQIGGCIDDDSKSVDITGLDYIVFVVSEASADAAINLRTFVASKAYDPEKEETGNTYRKCLYPHPIADYATVENWETMTSITEPGIYVVKVSGNKYLRCIKSRGNWEGNIGSVKISLAYIGSGSTPAAPEDEITRVGEDALTDANATWFDVTGLTESGIPYNPTNSNALFVANDDDELTNDDNVIVSGTCDNLVLSDGNYPFRAYSTFTATSVSYDRTFIAGKKSTVCLPFALTAGEAAEAGKFYELAGVNAEGTALEFTDVTASGTTAYKPYIFEAKADGAPFNTYSSKTIAVTPNSLTFNGTTVEDYTLTGVLSGSTDVAADYEGKTVYGWSGNSGEEGTFVKVGTGVSINPFRAYVVYSGDGGSSLARLAALFIENSLTGINEVSNFEDIKSVKNFEGKVFENGKIIIFKKGMKFNANGQLIK